MAVALIVLLPGLPVGWLPIAAFLGGLGAALLLGGCAQAPETVAAAPVSEAQYYGRSCPELRADLGRLDRTLADLYAEQRQSRNDDAIGYVFLWAPVASMSAVRSVTSTGMTLAYLSPFCTV